MSLLIKDKETIAACLPNIVQHVSGEVGIYNKLTTYIDLAESWVNTTFIGADVMYYLSELPQEQTDHQIVCQVIVCEALLRALPTLDVVLTPNGFGIVSNNTIAPASKERIERLLVTIEDNRDKLIEQLIPRLAYLDGWWNSPQRMWFTRTLFPTLSIVAEMNITVKRWSRYCELRREIIGIEAKLASEFFSDTQMQEWREQLLLDYSSTSISKIVEVVRSEIVNILKGNTLCTRRMMDVVNIIRNNPEKYPKWHSSETCKLFSPPRFENKKSANGYWF